MNGLQFLVLKDYVVVLAFFVCFDLILPLYGLTRNGIDVAGVDTIAGFSIDRVKTHLLPLGRRGGEGEEHVTRESFRYPFQNGRTATDLSCG